VLGTCGATGAECELVLTGCGGTTSGPVTNSPVIGGTVGTSTTELIQSGSCVTYPVPGSSKNCLGNEECARNEVCDPQSSTCVGQFCPTLVAITCDTGAVPYQAPHQCGTVCVAASCAPQDPACVTAACGLNQVCQRQIDPACGNASRSVVCAVGGSTCSRDTDCRDNEQCVTLPITSQNTCAPTDCSGMVCAAGNYAVATGHTCSCLVLCP
jgi:hypothetical protein